MFRDSRVFLKQFFRQYHTTGSILPSSRALAKALCRYVDYKGEAESSNGFPAGRGFAGEGERQILEVGPGTGAVTACLVTKLRPDDRLTLCELNDDFVRHLQHRFATEPAFSAVADRSKIEHVRLENLPGEHCYEVIISGLPLNNFEVHEVEQILGIFRRLLRPGGTLSFFEYIAVRKAKSLITSQRRPAAFARHRGGARSGLEWPGNQARLRSGQRDAGVGASCADVIAGIGTPCPVLIGVDRTFVSASQLRFDRIKSASYTRIGLLADPLQHGAGRRLPARQERLRGRLWRARCAPSGNRSAMEERSSQLTAEETWSEDFSQGLSAPSASTRSIVRPAATVPAHRSGARSSTRGGRRPHRRRTSRDG